MVPQTADLHAVFKINENSVFTFANMGRNNINEFEFTSFGKVNIVDESLRGSESCLSCKEKSFWEFKVEEKPQLYINLSKSPQEPIRKGSATLISKSHQKKGRLTSNRTLNDFCSTNNSVYKARDVLRKLNLKFKARLHPYNLNRELEFDENSDTIIADTASVLSIESAGYRDPNILARFRALKAVSLLKRIKSKLY